MALVDTIKALEAKRYDLMVGHDLPRLAELLDDTLTYVHSTGLIDSKAAYLSLLETRVLVYHAAGVVESTFDVTDSRVIQHGLFRAEIDWNGTAKSLSNFFTNVWVKRPDGWKMSLWQSTGLPISVEAATTRS
jgi:hypothetical protein